MNNYIETFQYKNMDSIRLIEIEPGIKIYCEGQKHAYKLESELNVLNIETRVGCNEAGMWSVYIIKVPEQHIM